MLRSVATAIQKDLGASIAAVGTIQDVYFYYCQWLLHLLHAQAG